MDTEASSSSSSISADADSRPSSITGAASSTSASSISRSSAVSLLTESLRSGLSNSSVLIRRKNDTWILNSFFFFSYWSWASNSWDAQQRLTVKTQWAKGWIEGDLIFETELLKWININKFDYERYCPCVAPWPLIQPLVTEIRSLMGYWSIEKRTEGTLKNYCSKSKWKRPMKHRGTRTSYETHWSLFLPQARK